MKLNTTLISPLFHFLIILFSIFSFSSLQVYGSSNETDRLALLQIKQGITSDPHGVLNSWNASNTLCNWFGVSCGRRHQRVLILNLEGKKLKGMLSPNVGNLSFLRTLIVHNNSLHGQIPSEIGNLFRLQHLLIGNNSLSGEIPANLSRCTQLQIMILEYNHLIGDIPQGLGNLANLEMLALGMNNFTGKIPVSLANLSSLVFFSVVYNNLAGKVPRELGRLKKLNSFSVAINNLSGTIHPSLFNISSLEILSLTMNRFEGNLPENLGITLPNIREILIGGNFFSGSIPNSFFNGTNLERVVLAQNKLVGKVPNTLGSLKNLWWLSLNFNNLDGGSQNSWAFLASLTNCTSLSFLDLSGNNFGGVLPDFIGNLSSQLNTLFLIDNQIIGSIPATIENLTKLIAFSLENNFLNGTIPSNLDKFQYLQALSLSSNRLSGSIPMSIGNLTHFYFLNLSQNKLEGTIPNSIKDCKSLRELDISRNHLSGIIPKHIPIYLNTLNISCNIITGHLPIEIGKLASANLIDISENRLSGEIPQSLGECLSLESLYLQGNSFQGGIPSSLSSLRGLQYLDISRNNLTGEIPPDLQNLPFALYLNLSFNELEGEVPTRGVFRNTNLFSVAGNEKICGGLPKLGLPKCYTKPAHNGKRRAQNLAAITTSAALFIVSMSAILVIYHMKRKQKAKNHDRPSFLTNPHADVSYWDLHRATNGFSSDNLIGSGTYGLVYKGFLHQLKRYTAIKVLKLEEKGASKSFIAECKTLRCIRHRNLIKLLTYCSSLDHAGNEFKALIFEFMENGSLENHLRSLNFIQRLNITIDVASALHYLHDLCEGPIIHCDLKPSNILLDDNYVAHLSDFGLAKIFFSINDESQSQISSIGLKGTIGYAPPEYGLGGVTSKEGDVYSFGILVLELFSGKKPTHEMFKDGLNLHECVNNSLPQALWELIDPSVLSGEPEPEARSTTSHTNKLEQCLLSALKVGLACSPSNPIERQKIGDAVKELHLVKSAFLGVRIYG